MKYIIITIICAVGIFIGVYVFKQYSNKNVENIPQISQSDLEKVKQYMAQEAAQNPTVQQKGNEAGLKANMSIIGIETKKAYSGNSSGYIAVCENGVLSESLSNINYFIKQLLTAQGVSTQSSAQIKCVASKDSFAVSIESQSPRVFKPLSFCVDSTGYSGNGLVDREKLLCNRE